MTRRVNELQRISLDRLMYAVENKLPGAPEALREFQKIRNAGGTPQIWWSHHHGYVVKQQ
jgi:hypothetical protein